MQPHESGSLLAAAECRRSGRSRRPVAPKIVYAAARIMILGAILAIAALTALVAHAVVIGPDERSDLTEHEHEEFKSVGVIMSGGTPRGTAFLVCDCQTVATAAHVVGDARGPVLDRDIQVLFEGDGGKTRLLQKATILFGAPPRPDVYDPSTDWLIARLDLPVPNCRPLQPKLSGAVKQWRAVTLVGFHSDSHAREISRECNISLVLAHKGLLVHMCDGKAGMSGSPLLLTEVRGLEHTHRVVAIQTGEQRSFGFNVGALILDDFDTALRRYVTSCCGSGDKSAFPTS